MSEETTTTNISSSTSTTSPTTNTTIKNNQDIFEFEKITKFFTRSLNALPKPYTSGLPNHLSLIYFTVSGLDLLNKLDLIESEKQNIIDWVYSQQILPSSSDHQLNLDHCGFRGFNYIGLPFTVNNINAIGRKSVEQEPPKSYDLPSLANTYCALLLLRILGDDFSGVDKKSILESLKFRQMPDGSFSGSPNVYESDMRYLFCACAISFMLDDFSSIDIDRAVSYILASQSYEFGFAQGPNQEAHGGSTFCAIASLTLLDKLNVIPNPDKFVHWLINKQITGFCGRTNKDPDSCYSFWIGASLEMMGKHHLVDLPLLRGYLASAQHSVIGGISKEPGEFPDVLHTYMSLSGLAIAHEPKIEPLNCVLGISQRAAGPTWNEKLLKKLN
eukprot:gene7555-9289_t